MTTIRKIISGGQAGADRAALDFALDHGIPHGGWCPRGRMAEDGLHDDRAGHRLRHRQGEVVRGEHAAIKELVVTGWPRHARRAGRVVEMGVGVDQGEFARAGGGLTGHGPKRGGPTGEGHSGDTCRSVRPA